MTRSRDIMGNYVITVLFVSVMNEELYFLDSGLKYFLFIISSKSTLKKKRFICKVLLYLSPGPNCICHFVLPKMNIVVTMVLFFSTGLKEKQFQVTVSFETSRSKQYVSNMFVRIQSSQWQKRTKKTYLFEFLTLGRHGISLFLSKFLISWSGLAWICMYLVQCKNY